MSSVWHFIKVSFSFTSPRRLFTQCIDAGDCYICRTCSVVCLRVCLPVSMLVTTVGPAKPAVGRLIIIIIIIIIYFLYPT